LQPGLQIARGGQAALWIPKDRPATDTHAYPSKPSGRLWRRISIIRPHARRAPDAARPPHPAPYVRKESRNAALSGAGCEKFWMW